MNKNGVRLFVFAALLLLDCGKTSLPKRPDNVPAGATLAPGGKIGGWWHYCEFIETDHQAYCHIWNVAGLILYEGVFLPYDHQPIEAGEIKVVYNPRWGDDSQFIHLQNGRILIPESNFRRLSQFADWLSGKRSSPP
jgi:hypothetical protein